MKFPCETRMVWKLLLFEFIFLLILADIYVNQIAGGPHSYHWPAIAFAGGALCGWIGGRS